VGDFRFDGFSRPTYTIVPDEVFDRLLPVLSGAELKVLMYVIRRTFGFGKDADAISAQQLADGIVTRDGRVLDYGTGLARSSIKAATASLVDKGVLIVERTTDVDGGDSTNIYRLRFVGES
jgi:replication protein O